MTQTSPAVPAPVKSGGVAAAVEPERIELANSGVRTAELVGELLLLQPLRTEMWTTENGERETVVTRIIHCTPGKVNAAGKQWVDHGDLPIFWGVVRKALEEQSTADYPWVVGRIVQRPMKEGSKRNPPYVLLAPTPEELAMANTVLTEWVATDPTTFASAASDDTGEEPF